MTRTASAERADRTDRARRLPAAPSWTAAVIGAVIVAIALSIATDSFLTGRNLTNVLAQTAVLAILATGQTFVMITGGIDLSVAAVAALTGTLLGAFSVTRDWPTALALGLALGAALCAGLLQGTVIARYAMPAFIVTLGGLLVWRGIALQAVGGINTTGLPEPITWLGQADILGLPVSGLIALVVVAISAIVLGRTRFGVGLRALGGAEAAALRSGVPVRRYRTAAYVISSGLAGLGGVLLVARLDSAGGSLASGLELQVIAAAAIGGVSLFGGAGSPWGAFFGAILIGTIQNGMNLLGVSSFMQQIASGLILVGAVAVDQGRKRLVGGRS